MPANLLERVITMEVGAQEPWPSDVKLYQPYAVEQILLTDNANCLAVQAFLHMCGLEFEIVHKANAEHMSPSGKVPFIKCGAFVVSELEPIVQFVGNKGITLTADLDQEQKADMRAYMSIIHTVLLSAELYICWCDKQTYNKITKVRHGSVYPWPLNIIQNYTKHSQVIKKLKILGWYQKTLKEIYQEVDTCCQALSERLEGKEYFFGSNPVELDALCFGHLSAILSLPYYTKELVRIVEKHTELICYCEKISKIYNVPIDYFNNTLKMQNIYDTLNSSMDSEMKFNYGLIHSSGSHNSTLNLVEMLGLNTTPDLLENSISTIDNSKTSSSANAVKDVCNNTSDDTLHNILSIRNSESNKIDIQHDTPKHLDENLALINCNQSIDAVIDDDDDVDKTNLIHADIIDSDLPVVEDTLDLENGDKESTTLLPLKLDSEENGVKETTTSLPLKLDLGDGDKESTSSLQLRCILEHEDDESIASLPLKLDLENDDDNESSVTLPLQLDSEISEKESVTSLPINVVVRTEESMCISLETGSTQYSSQTSSCQISDINNPHNIEPNVRISIDSILGEIMTTVDTRINQLCDIETLLSLSNLLHTDRNLHHNSSFDSLLGEIPLNLDRGNIHASETSILTTDSVFEPKTRLEDSIDSVTHEMITTVQVNQVMPQSQAIVIPPLVEESEVKSSIEGDSSSWCSISDESKLKSTVAEDAPSWSTISDAPTSSSNDKNIDNGKEKLKQ